MGFLWVCLLSSRDSVWRRDQRRESTLPVRWAEVVSWMNSSVVVYYLFVLDALFLFRHDPFKLSPSGAPVAQKHTMLGPGSLHRDTSSSRS